MIAWCFFYKFKQIFGVIIFWFKFFKIILQKNFKKLIRLENYKYFS